MSDKDNSRLSLFLKESLNRAQWSFPLKVGKLSELSEFTESDKSLKHGLGSV